jgi:hypothetical protein
MQIRITIRLSPVKPIDPGQIRNVFKQLPCFGHHREKIELSSGKLRLRCVRCGRESPGWDLERREDQNVLTRQTTVHLG